ncbi:sigma factor-like helix-turn-helix DNA-binding protein [Chloroflexota bacterium]
MQSYTYPFKLQKSGLTFAEIGRRFGLNRERVRQIVRNNKSSGNIEPTLDNPDMLLTTRQAAEILNIHLYTIRRGMIREY